jgi:hypothetical protein
MAWRDTKRPSYLFESFRLLRFYTSHCDVSLLPV